MWLLALLLALAALWTWAKWRRKTAPKSIPASRQRRTRRWPPFLALTGMFLLFALVELLQPRTPPFAGKWGHLLDQVYASLGAYGIAGIWFALAIASAGLTWLLWRRDESSAASLASFREL